MIRAEGKWVDVRLRRFGLSEDTRSTPSPDSFSPTSDAYPLRGLDPSTAEYVDLVPASDLDMDGEDDVLMVARKAWPMSSARPRGWIISGKSLQPIRALSEPEEGGAPTAGTLVLDPTYGVQFAIGRSLSSSGRGLVTLQDAVDGSIRRSLEPPTGALFFGQAVVCVSSTAEPRSALLLAVGAPNASSLSGGVCGAVMALDLASAASEPRWALYGEDPAEPFGAGYGGQMVGLSDVDGDAYTDLAVPVYDANDRYHRKGVDVVSGLTGARLWRIPPPAGLERFGANLTTDASGKFLAVSGRKTVAGCIFVYGLDRSGASLLASITDDFFLQEDIQGLGLSVEDGKPTIAILTGIVRPSTGIDVPMELRVYGIASEKRKGGR